MARLMDQVVGHAAVKDQLLRLTRDKKFFNAVLFAGPEGVGKKRLARAVVQEMNCPHTPACGTCANCLKVAGAADAGLSKMLANIDALEAAMAKHP